MAETSEESVPHVALFGLWHSRIFCGKDIKNSGDEEKMTMIQMLMVNGVLTRRDKQPLTHYVKLLLTSSNYGVTIFLNTVLRLKLLKVYSIVM